MMASSEMLKNLDEIKDTIASLERSQARHFSPVLEEKLEELRRKVILASLTRVTRRDDSTSSDE